MVQYHPQLKKRDEEFPVSDLKFVSKLIEKPVVAWQLNDRILDRDVDKNNSGIFFFLVYFFLLDLSAAFDTLGHGILLSRVSTRF